MKSLIIGLWGISMLIFPPARESVKGAWESKGGENTTVRIYTEGFFSVATYSLQGKQFDGTYGGKYRIEGDEMIETVEFDTWDPSKVGTERKMKLDWAKGNMTLTEKEKTTFVRLDDGGPGKLAGAWIITGRMVDNQFRKGNPGARRTMKILSGSRFQWIAYNMETKEFFGTGGGNYTTVDGKYTENIEFFSRDNSRVGMSLSFDFSLEDGNWRHKGLSSKGDPIDEIWTQREKVGL